jgi:hypothetical protein
MSQLSSPFQKRPAYKYIRETDKLPTYDELSEKAVCKIKLFDPTGAGTWYLASYDPDTEVAFGVADLGMGPELGDIYMPELVEHRGRFGLPIERDLHYKPMLAKDLLS